MIYITGDTHGLTDVLKFKGSFFPEKDKMTKNDFVLITGDFGGIWDGSERDKQTLDFFSSQPFTTLFVDGNHENFDLLNSYPVEEWNGGKVHKIRDDIIHLMRGQVFTIEGHTYFTFGGGISIDKLQRTEHVTWWREEFASFREKEEGVENLKRHNNKVDFIVTHTCPESLKNGDLSRCISLKNVKCDTEQYLEEIYKITDYKLWFCGHYHSDLYFEEYKLLLMYHEKLNPVALLSELDIE